MVRLRGPTAGLGRANVVMSEFHSADTNEDGELQYDEFSDSSATSPTTSR